MDKSTLIIAGATLLSGFLIVCNEWIKKCFESKYNMKKFALWDKIFIEGAKGKQFSGPDDLLYELLKDGLVELEVLVGTEDSIICAYAKGLKPEI